MEAELSRRFALRYLEDMVARRQQEHTNALFSQYDESITDMQADIRLLSTSAC